MPFVNTPQPPKAFVAGPQRISIIPVINQHMPIVFGPPNGCVIDFLKVRYETNVGGAALGFLKRVPNAVAASTGVGSSGVTRASTGDASTGTSATATVPGDRIDFNTTAVTLYEIKLDKTNNILLDKEVLVLSLSAAVGTLAGFVVEVGYRPL